MSGLLSRLASENSEDRDIEYTHSDCCCTVLECKNRRLSCFQFSEVLFIYHIEAQDPLRDHTYCTFSITIK